MALIKVGSVNDFSVTLKKPVRNEKTKKLKLSLNSLTKIQELDQISSEIPVDTFELVESKEARGISLKSIKLNKNFESFLGNIFDKKNEIYFLAWAYDLSGQPISFYPGEGFENGDVIIPIRAGDIREFLGEGINLFAKRRIKGGIALRIQIWESDEKNRTLGETLKQTSSAIQESKLNNLLSAVSMVTGAPGVTIALVKDAALELAKVIGIILAANGDDYVDLFEGYYVADNTWKSGEEKHTGTGAEITLMKY